MCWRVIKPALSTYNLHTANIRGTHTETIYTNYRTFSIWYIKNNYRQDYRQALMDRSVGAANMFLYVSR